MLRLFCSVILLIFLVGCDSSNNKIIAEQSKSFKEQNIDSILPFKISNELVELHLPDSVKSIVTRDEDNIISYFGFQYQLDSITIACLSKNLDTMNYNRWNLNSENIHLDYKKKLVMRLGEVEFTRDSILNQSKHNVKGVFSGVTENHINFTYKYQIDSSYMHQFIINYTDPMKEKAKLILETYKLK